ncbi:MAG: threonine synthase [Nitrospirota bacterium]
MMSWPGIIQTYRAFLPVTDQTPIVTLFEGNTPLVPAKNLCRALSLPIDLYLKYEGANPTGSFKDRGMTMAITKAKESGAKAVICASTGNTSASAAAFGARAGLRVYVLIPEGKISLGKLAQAMMHGATVIQITGNFDEALVLVKEIAQRYPITLVNSINPFRLEGQKTAAFEICDQMGRAPDYHFLPVGNAGNITAYWRGYKEFYQLGRIAALPKMMGFQAAGAAPIVLGHIVEQPQTIATAIRIGNPASWKEAVFAADESHGAICSVTDDEIIEAYHQIAALEGFFCEPASAASVAGVIKWAQGKSFLGGETVVCTLTGHGLKDADFAIGRSEKPVTVPAEMNAVLNVLKV